MIETHFLSEIWKYTNKGSKNVHDNFDHNNDDVASENENVSTSTEERIGHSPKEHFSVLEER